MIKFTLIGGGGHCESLLKALPKGLEPLGYTDLAPAPGLALPYLGTDSAASGPVHIAVALGADDSLATRRRVIDRFSAFEFVTIVAPTAIIAHSSIIGSGSAVLHRAVVNGAAIGRNCIVNTGAILEHSVAVGENCFIGPGAIICGGVTIGSDTVIGAGAIVRNGVKICGGAVIGMGAVVTRDITAPGRYVGNPARKMQ